MLLNKKCFKVLYEPINTTITPKIIHKIDKQIQLSLHFDMNISVKMCFKIYSKTITDPSDKFCSLYMSDLFVNSH